MTQLLGVDAGCADAASAEHLLHDVEQVLGEAPPWSSTHVVRAGGSHVAVAVSSGPDGFTADPRAWVERVAGAVPRAAVALVDGDASYDAGPPGHRDGAREALGRHRDRSEGRLVRFPGAQRLRGEVTAAAVVSGGVVDVVVGLAGLDVGPSSVLDLGDFVRPTWRDGRCVLLVQAAAGCLVPFEARHQIPCCHDH